MITKKASFAVAGIVMGAVVLGATNTASAQFMYYGAPAYCAPAPVVVASAPVVVSAPVYYSRPVYYAAPVAYPYYAPVYRSGFSFGFGWSGGHHHGCRW
jgi:hypothetical protein